MLSTIYSATISGVNAIKVIVEANSGERGDPKCILVGLPDASVKESLDRVFSSLSNTGYAKPRTRVTINLAPGDLRKEGAAFDLPIALSLLASTGQIKHDILGNYLIAGELALSGATRHVKGGLAMAMLAKKIGKAGIILPKSSALEACLIEGINVYSIESLDEAIKFFEDKKLPNPLNPIDSPILKTKERTLRDDFSEVKGQYGLRRAVEIAVAGEHNLLIMGPPGAGKSMVAKRIPSILPRPLPDEFLEILNIYSVQGESWLSKNNGMLRPVRSPHHTISDIGLLGG